MKKILIIALTMILVLSFSSCGLKDKVKGKLEEKADELIDEAIEKAADKISEETGMDIDKEDLEKIKEEVDIDKIEEVLSEDDDKDDDSDNDDDKKEDKKKDKKKDKKDGKIDISDLNIRDDADIDMDLLYKMLDDGFEAEKEPVYHHTVTKYREGPGGEFIEGEMIVWLNDGMVKYFFKSGDMKNYYAIPADERDEEDDMVDSFDSQEAFDEDGLSNVLALKYDKYDGKKAIYMEVEDYDEELGTEVIAKVWMSAKTRFPLHSETYSGDGELLSEVTFVEIYFDDDFMDELDPPEGYEW